MRNDRRPPTKTWGMTRRRWLSQERPAEPARQARLRRLRARPRSGRCPDRGARVGNRSARRSSLLRRSCRPAGLPARRRHPHRARDRVRGSVNRPLRHSGGAHEPRRPRALGALLRRASPPGSITKTGNTRVRRLLVEAAWSAGRRPQVGEGLSSTIYLPIRIVPVAVKPAGRGFPGLRVGAFEARALSQG